VTHANDRAVDIDRLADYAAGALDRATAAEVSHLIATRPAWADAYLALVAADATTRAELRDYARSHLEPMPADVIARLDAAFGRSSAAGSAAVPGRIAAIGSTRVTRLEQARRRRRFGSFATAAAAVVLVLAGLGVVAGLIQPSSNNLGGASTADRGSSENSQNNGGAGAPAPAAPSAPPLTSPLVYASGTDYRPDTLADVLTLGSRVPPAIAGTAQPGGQTKDALPQLDDLRKMSALMGGGSSLQACLAAITRSQPGTVAVVDFAQYEARPAVVVLIRDSIGGPGVVVVVGPGCSSTDAEVRVVKRLP
jgi:hypothetical protein